MCLGLNLDLTEMNQSFVNSQLKNVFLFCEFVV